MNVGLLGRFRPERIDHHDGGAVGLAIQRPAPAPGYRLQPIPGADSGIGSHQEEVVTGVDVGTGTINVEPYMASAATCSTF